MQHSKLASVWFPSKGYDAFCNKNKEGSKLCQLQKAFSYQRTLGC